MKFKEILPSDMPESFLIRGATLITMDERKPRQMSDAVLWVKNGKIGGIFSTIEEVPEILHSITQIDAEGKTLMPGLTDGHAHLDRETLGDDLVDFSNSQTLDEMLDLLADAVRSSAPGEWVVTRPLGTPPDYPNAENPLVEGVLPTRQDLDKVSRHNPIFIRPIWGYWNLPARKFSFANSMALKLNGVCSKVQSPHPDLKIIRDTQGVPTGQFVETAPHTLVEHTLMRQAPGFSLEQRAAAIRRAFVRYAAFGTTAVFEGHGVATEVLEAYLCSLFTSFYGLRISLPLSPHWPSLGSLSNEMDTWGDRFSPFHSLAKVDGIYVDCAEDLSAHVLRAADYPRTGWAGFTSASVLPPTELELQLLECARLGLRVCGINPRLLPLMEKVHRKYPINGLRWTLGHQATLNSEQISLISEMGLYLTTITGHHLERGVYTRNLIGTDREKEIVPLKTLQSAGIPVVLGSDNRPISLWESIQQAVTRVDTLGRVVSPEERLDAYDALRLVTVNGAKLTGDEKIRGVLKKDYAADFVILNQNPLLCAPTLLKDTRSLATFIAGKIIMTGV